MAKGAVLSSFVILALFVFQPLPQAWGAMLRNAMDYAPPLKQHQGRASG
ncbi:Uncharacterised protein [Grimontia hollisae]|uniref:Uncharacterized protein n=1 Tax=Grimontia hollisae TaxID=673 RepID=A0A377JAC8_GRIHO|nr:Uncharacterised protein [Grimontia hollisae]